MSVHKFTDGRSGWYFQFYYEGKKYKKEKWKGEHLNSKAAALNAESQFKEQLKHQHDMVVMSVHQLYDEYVSAAKSNLKENTIRYYESFKKNYLPMIPDVSIYDLSPGHVLKFKNSIVDMDLSITYKNRALRCFKNVLEYGHLMYNLKGSLQFSLIEPLKNNDVAIMPSKNKSLPQADFERMIGFLDLDNDNQFYYYVVINVLYYTGLRIGELAALTPADIVDSSFVINKDYVRVSGVDYIQAPKNKNSIRIVAMDHTTYGLVMDYIERIHPVGTLFHLESAYLNQQKVRRVLSWLAVESGINEKYETHPHALRHSHASNLRLLGFDEYAISKRLGNTPTTAANIYIHADDNEQRVMVEKLRDK